MVYFDNASRATFDDRARTYSAEVAALVAALGTGQAHVITTLMDHGIRAESVALLEWLPAVDVCWVDGSDAGERHALRLQYAIDDRACDAGVAVLDGWLSTPPPAALLAAGQQALRARLAQLDVDERETVVDRIVALCEAAGRAAGAGFGVSPLSSRERARIAQLRLALA